MLVSEGQKKDEMCDENGNFSEVVSCSLSEAASKQVASKWPSLDFF